MNFKISSFNKIAIIQKECVNEKEDGIALQKL